MTNQEMIVSVLQDHSCLTAQEIKGFVNRKFDTIISPQAIAGCLRPLVAAGVTTKGISPTNNKTVYWITDYGKTYLAKGRDVY